MAQEIINGYQPTPIPAWYFYESFADVTWDCKNFCSFCSSLGISRKGMNLYSGIEFYKTLPRRYPIAHIEAHKRIFVISSFNE